MELKGTIQSVQNFEQSLVVSFPHKLLHDGGHEHKSFKEDGKSQCYSKLYQLFPYGGKHLWEDRVNVRFYFDERFGIGTVKISAKGIQMLPSKVKELMRIVEDVYTIPKSKMTLVQARKFGAINIGGEA